MIDMDLVFANRSVALRMGEEGWFVHTENLTKLVSVKLKDRLGWPIEHVEIQKVLLPSQFLNGEI